MSDTKDDQSKRDEVNTIIKFMIAALSTMVGWKFLGTGMSPLETDFWAVMVYICAVFVYVAALRAKLICDNSLWHQIIGDLAELAGHLASVALVVIAFWPFGLFAFGVWLFWFLWIMSRWIRNLSHEYVTRIRAIADNLHELVHPSTAKQVDQNSLPV